LRIGRSEGNDYQIADPSVSGRHCEVTLDRAGSLLVRDVGSTNGTFVEGQRITEALMKPGQALRLGNVELAFENTKSANDAAAARVELAEPILHQHDPVEDLGAMYLVSTPNGEYRAPADAAGHANLSASFARGVILQQRYVLERELGRGAMGQVFLARDIRLTRSVAIKVILVSRGGQANSDSSEAEELRRAFEQEAQLGANLNHPAIATVYDYGFHQGNPFTVFEYIEGETLQQWLRRRKRIPLDEVRLIVAPLAQGLDYAHSHHIVHRDLKPANIRATPQGDFKILDLGLAKRLLQADEQAGFAGTPAYASPEQASGLPMDGRTDQYALALIVYEMITGQRPFQADTPEAMLRLHREGQVPDPRSLATDSADAAEVRTPLLRALDNDPNKRFYSCKEFAVALGCQLRSTVSPASAILLEADVRSRSSLWWRSYWKEGGWKRHLVLVPHSVWCDDGWEIRCWPIGEIGGVKKSLGGMELQFTLPGESGARQRFLFPRRKDCAEWYEHLTGQRQIAEAKPPTNPSRVHPTPVVLLRQRPNLRLQLLGPLEAEGKARWSREAALRTRAALLGADAVVGIEEERRPELGRAVRRASGTAVRAVEREGIAELKGLWFDERVSRLTNTMVGLAVPTACIFASLFGYGPSLVVPRALAIACAIWPLVVALSLRVLRWPQLMPAAVIAFVAYQGVALLLPVSIVAAGWHVTHSILATVAFSVFLLMFGAPLALAWLAFGLPRGYRIWQVHREFRLASANVAMPAKHIRTSIGHVLAISSSLAAVLLLIAFTNLAFLSGKSPPTQPPPLFGARHLTNDLPDIAASWVFDSSWHEERTAAQLGLQYLFKSKDWMIAQAEVQETLALPPKLRGDSMDLLKVAQERFSRYSGRLEQVGHPQPVWGDGPDHWLEAEFKAAFAISPNIEYHFLLRVHADSIRQATLLVGCPSPVWDRLRPRISAAADGFHLRPFKPTRRLEPVGHATRIVTYKGKVQPYLCKVSEAWGIRTPPSLSDPGLTCDLYLTNREDMNFEVLLESLPELGDGLFVSLLQDAEIVQKNLQRKCMDFQLLAGENVEVGGCRGRLLRFRFRVGQLQFTEVLGLVAHSGWLYHLRAWSRTPNLDPALLEDALAGIEFPRDSAN
jgi:serine/threonine protein kinase